MLVRCGRSSTSDPESLLQIARNRRNYALKLLKLSTLYQDPEYDTTLQNLFV
jgi:Tfp pilus assembly protein PilP